MTIVVRTEHFHISIQMFQCNKWTLSDALYETDEFNLVNEFNLDRATYFRSCQ